jgi:glycosyltransferase involved in cell wall biosynthesis
VTDCAEPVDRPSESGSGLKTLLVLTADYGRPDSSELEKREEADEGPRATLLEKQLGADLLYDRFPAATPGYRRRLYRYLPRNVPQVIEAFLLRERYDAIVTWAEAVTLPLALLLKLSRSRVPHVAIFSSITQAKKALLLKAVHSHVGRLLINSTAQKDFAVGRLGIPAGKVVAMTWSVDQKFWRPLDVEIDRISSSGRELRDYGTLVRALRDVEVRCHIAAKVIPWRKDAWREELKALEPLPPHVSVGYGETLRQVRDHYARSRFVVLPLLEADYELGSTVLLEAMAMGKAVVCTRVKGQRDLLQDGKTGLFVPVKDVEGWKKAIRYLWENPALAEEMGREARRQVEQKYRLDDWVGQVRAAVRDAIREGSGRSHPRRKLA